ncbi:MAG: NADH-quinone oxidoreductase subunit K [Hydrogenophaga sp.]|uniref:sodium:proton antiporter n=1 Tax=Hydrogenophaga sp. TaxID=1904254 RepID=UPI001BC0DB34|nr:NADH-quinone oxidoreductase subunit K [Hydrogenophaga sp.]MBS3912563.1 NADH-quinone oxidoreductase subunit K [Hydrogenophaga sp.]MDP2163713.1 NADH-quinone oxidoreductase subunit K [Hydrogenophaga sp.]MDP3475941.1 NADH-quinone oxidoreductase subunit K [Hydrogenophaga sp.]
MIWLLGLVVWIVASAGVYLAFSKDVFRCVLGLALMGSAANLILFASGRIDVMNPAVVPLGETVLQNAANPLPQALVLTAIVIGFALVCYSLTLALRLIQASSTDDLQALRMAEPVPTDSVKPPYNGAAHEPTWPGAQSLPPKEVP